MEVTNNPWKGPKKVTNNLQRKNYWNSKVFLFQEPSSFRSSFQVRIRGELQARSFSLIATTLTAQILYLQHIMTEAEYGECFLRVYNPLLPSKNTTQWSSFEKITTQWSPIIVKPTWIVWPSLKDSTTFLGHSPRKKNGFDHSFKMWSCYKADGIVWTADNSNIKNICKTVRTPYWPLWFGSSKDIVLDLPRLKIYDKLKQINLTLPLKSTIRPSINHPSGQSIINR